MPSYGSTDWLTLPEGDPRKIAAVVIAAECWARGADDLERNLRLVVDNGRRAHKQAEDADYRANDAAHREHWAHLSVVPVVGPYDGQRVRDLYDIGREAMSHDRG